MKLHKLFKKPRKRPRRPSPLMEKVQRIDETVTDISMQLAGMQADIWNQLAEMKEQQAQKPSIMLGMPTENGAEITMLEPLEGLEPIEGVSDVDE